MVLKHGIVVPKKHILTWKLLWFETSAECYLWFYYSLDGIIYLAPFFSSFGIYFKLGWLIIYFYHLIFFFSYPFLEKNFKLSRKKRTSLFQLNKVSNFFIIFLVSTNFIFDPLFLLMMQTRIYSSWPKFVNGLHFHNA